MSQLKQGVILSYVNILVANAVGLVITPFIIRRLGDSEYGLYMLIGSLIAYFTLMDLGLNNTIVRYVALYRTSKDKKGEENFLGLTFLIYAITAVAVLVIGTFVHTKLDEIFDNSLTTLQIIDAKRMFTILVFNIAITLPGGAFIAICNAYERFAFPRILLLVKYLTRSALVFGLLGVLPHAITLVWIDSIVNILFILVSIYFVFSKLKVKIRLGKVNFWLLKEIASYAMWIFLAAIVMSTQWNIGQIILGVFKDTATVAIFGVGILLGGYYGAFAGAINTLMLPKAAKMSVESNTKESYNDAMIKIGRLNAFISFLILFGFILFGKEFIVLWIGANYIEAWEIALLIMLAMTLPLLQAFGNSILEAKKRNRFRSLVSVITIGAASGIGFFLVPLYSIQGIIYPLFAALIINSITMAWYYMRIFGFRILLFLDSVILKVVAPTIVLVGFCFYLKIVNPIESWLDLILHVVLYSTLYLIILYLLVLSREEKNIMLRKFQ
jgi:O-antigen/teichoic acid export membrane protein